TECSGLDSLNARTRWGLSPCASQIRCTVAGLTPCALAIDRQLQCVSPGGVDCVVATTISLTFAAEIERLRPRPSFTSVSACGPPSANRSRHKITVGRLTHSCLAISLLDSPSAAINTIRARVATLCGVPCALAHRSSSARCPSETSARTATTMPWTLHQPSPTVKLFQRHYTSNHTVIRLLRRLG